VKYNLHPPLLRRMGRTEKISLGPSFVPVLRGLRAVRRVRGTPLDPFGRTASRREERELIGWYEELIETALPKLSEASLPTAIELAELPDGIRGYEDIKSRTAERARIRARALLRQLDAPLMELPMLGAAG
jgi:indolepyruvate ferredoxin oxidoreductase